MATSPRKPRALIWRDSRGVAAVEFAFLALLLSLVTLNVADLAIYTYQSMELQNASQAGAQAAWQTCDQTKVPAVSNCPSLNSAVTAAVQSTSLGSGVTLVSGYPAEGYYCVNSSGALQYVSDTSSKPATCTAAGTPLLQPGDYIKIQVSYAYAPLFGNLSVGALFTTPVVATTWMRLS